MIALFILAAVIILVAISHERNPEKKEHLQEWRHHHKNWEEGPWK